MELTRMCQWMYLEDIPDDVAPAKKLLVEYSGFETRVVDDHLHAVRDQAWRMARIPSIGRWRFLRLPSGDDCHYRHAIGRLRDPRSRDVLLDLGCGLGQVMRQAIHEGADPSRVFGLDSHALFVELGFSLFGDEERLRSQFIIRDIFGRDCDRDDSNGADGLDRIKGRVTMVHATSFWHLFGWDEQVAIAGRVVQLLLRPGGARRARRAVIFGSQAGSMAPTETRPGGAYLHDQASFQRLWDEVGRKTKTRWRVALDLAAESVEQIPGVGKDVRVATYGVYQV